MPQRRTGLLIAALFVCAVLLILNCKPAPESVSETPTPAKPDLNATEYQRLSSEEKSLLSSNPDSSTLVRRGYINLDMAKQPEGSAIAGDLTEKANTAFKKALEIDGTRNDAYLGLALTKDIGESPEEVLALYDETIGGSPSNDKNKKLLLAYQFLAKSYFNVNSKTAATKSVLLCNKLLELYPNDPVALSTLAKIHFNEGDFQKAESLAQKTIDLYAANDKTFSVNEAYHLIGQIRQQDGRSKEAEKLYKESIKTEMGKSWACAYQSLGGLYRNSGKPNQAAKMDMEYSDRIPKSAKAAFLAAYACFRVGDFINAIKYAERANHNQPDFTYQAFRGYLLLFETNYSEAEKVFESILSKDDTNSGALIGQGHLAVVHKDYGKATELLEPIISKRGQIEDELFTVACLGMGWAMANQNKHDKAVKYFDLILQDGAVDFLALMGKGNSLIGLKKLDEAAETLNRALKLQPGNPYALAELAMIKLKKGNHIQAEQGFKEALKGDSKNYTCPYEGLGLLYLQQGKTDLAKKNFEKSIKINPDIEYKKYNGLAKIYIKEGNLDQAEKLLKKSIENFPWDDEAKNLLKGIGR